MGKKEISTLTFDVKDINYIINVLMNTNFKGRDVFNIAGVLQMLQTKGTPNFRE